MELNRDKNENFYPLAHRKTNVALHSIAVRLVIYVVQKLAVLLSCIRVHIQKRGETMNSTPHPEITRMT
jgi:hypothetical protein